jgi:hypothetical protein
VSPFLFRLKHKLSNVTVPEGAGAALSVGAARRGSGAAAIRHVAVRGGKLSLLVMLAGDLAVIYII